MAGPSPAETDFKGSPTEMGTPPPTLAEKGVPKEEGRLGRSWKGPDELKRGGKAASHNEKATDYLESSPCLSEGPKPRREDGQGTAAGSHPGSRGGERKGVRWARGV